MLQSIINRGNKNNVISYWIAGVELKNEIWLRNYLISRHKFKVNKI